MFWGSRLDVASMADAQPLQDGFLSLCKPNGVTCFKIVLAI